VIDKRHALLITGPPDPPNPFFALKCSTSDPGNEAPSTRLRNSRRTPSACLPLKQSSACANRAPFPPLQPGTPDVPAMFAREGNSPGLEREQLSLGKSLRQNDLVGFMPTETNCAAAPIMPELATRKFNSGSGGRSHLRRCSDVDGM
jgi:hypothetical protein